MCVNAPAGRVRVVIRFSLWPLRLSAMLLTVNSLSLRQSAFRFSLVSLLLHLFRSSLL